MVSSTTMLRTDDIINNIISNLHMWEDVVVIEWLHEK
jgi:hypothetical protein